MHNFCFKIYFQQVAEIAQSNNALKNNIEDMTEQAKWLHVQAEYLGIQLPADLRAILFNSIDT